VKSVVYLLLFLMFAVLTFTAGMNWRDPCSGQLTAWTAGFVLIGIILSAVTFVLFLAELGGDQD
jgi:hypothetical protein